MKVNNIRILSVLLVSLPLIFNSCTLTGLGIGATVDRRKSDYEFVKPNNYNTISILSEITIYQNDRTVKKGKLIGITEDYLTLETMFGLEDVNRGDIFNIEVKSKKNAMSKGLRIGLGLDTVYILWLICCFEYE